jgi:hypothetical protein
VTRILLLAAVSAAVLTGPIERKFEAIETGRLRPGTNVVFTAAEIEKWSNHKAPRGLRDIRVELGMGRITARAQVDFLKLRQAATGEEAGWLGQNLLSGEHPVMVTARLESRSGEARVDISRVEIGGVPIEGPALDFLIRAFVMPQFPDARVNEWFRLAWRIDRITVNLQGIVVYIGR